MRILGVKLLFVVLSSAAVLDRVAIVVGDNVITEGEVLDELRLEEFLVSQPLDLSPQQRSAAAERLVDQQLIRREMEVGHYGQPEPAKADDMLRNFRQEHFRSDAAFRAALVHYGLTEDQLKRYLLWQLTVIEFTDERFHPNVQEAPKPEGNRAASDSEGAAPGSSANHPARGSTPTQSADRLAPGAPAGGDNGVDEELDAWLKEARASVRVEFKKEAFQ